MAKRKRKPEVEEPKTDSETEALKVSVEEPKAPAAKIPAKSIFSPEPMPVKLEKGCIVVKRSGRFLQVSCPTHVEAEIIEKTINNLLT